MIHNRLNDLLSIMKGKNVCIDLQTQQGNAFGGAISTTKFEYEVNELFLTNGNDCEDCEFEFKIPVIEILTIDDSEYADFSTVIINLKIGASLFVTLN